MDPAAAMSSPDRIAQFDKHVIPNYGRYPISLVRGEGSFCWDAEGKRYLDLFPGWGCNILGHCPPKVVEAIQQQAAKLIHMPNTWFMEPQGDFAEQLCTRSFGKAFFCNSGAEANEAAIKLARLHGMKEGRYKIITFEKGFHGRTLATTTATAQPKFHEGLGPLVAGFAYAPYGDLDAVADLVDHETCAIMIEPVQGEGGIRPVPAEFLRELRAICDEHGLLLIFDEIQCGIGRTAKLFHHEWAGVSPDIMTIAKGIGGGFPLGACMATSEAADGMVIGTHGSTYGGNPLGCAVGAAVLEEVLSEGFLDHVSRVSGHLRQGLEGLIASHPDVFESIRGEGLMLGIKCKLAPAEVVKAGYEADLITVPAADNVVRLMPPLTLSIEEADEAIARLGITANQIEQEG